MHIGSRLKMVAALCPACTALADIGTDHAYLPVFLVLEGKIQKAIAGDVVPGPCEAARRTIKSYHWNIKSLCGKAAGLRFCSLARQRSLSWQGWVPGPCGISLPRPRKSGRMRPVGIWFCSRRMKARNCGIGRRIMAGKSAGKSWQRKLAACMRVCTCVRIRDGNIRLRAIRWGRIW